MVRISSILVLVVDIRVGGVLKSIISVGDMRLETELLGGMLKHLVKCRLFSFIANQRFSNRQDAHEMIIVVVDIML